MNYCYDRHCCRCYKIVEEPTYANSLENLEMPLCSICQAWYNSLLIKPTSCAKMLFRHLRDRNIKADLESKDKYKTIDIVIKNALLHIEVDGSQHNLIGATAIRDLWRTYYSLKEEYITVHIPNSAIRYDVETTVKIISGIVIERKKQLRRLRELQLMQSKNAQQKLF